MATEVAPSAMAELTDLGKCLMKHEVGGGAVEVLSLPCWGACIHFTHFLVPPGGYLGNISSYGKGTRPQCYDAGVGQGSDKHPGTAPPGPGVQLPRAWVLSPSCTGFLFYTDWFLFLMA